MITEENFVLFAMNHYDNPQCFSIGEFEEDLKRFTYLKKLFYRYKNKEDLCERIILNHIVVLYNVFGDHATNMLFFKMESALWPYLATFLTYLKRMPPYVTQTNIFDYDIVLDEGISDALRKL